MQDSRKRTRVMTDKFKEMRKEERLQSDMKESKLFNCYYQNKVT